MGADEAKVRQQVLSTVDRWRGMANATQDPWRALWLRAAANSVERTLADLGTTAAVVAVTREAAALAVRSTSSRFRGDQDAGLDR